MFPLLSPTTFFLLVVNIVYAFFDTFASSTRPRGRPGAGDQILVYKVYNDGFKAADLGGSAAQSVILMVDRDRADRRPVPLHRAQGAVLMPPMVENRPWLTFLTHAVLILGVLVVAFPLYVTFVASTLTLEEILQAPMPLVPGDQLVENYSQVLTARPDARVARAPVGQMMLNSLVMALVIAIGKIAISLIVGVRDRLLPVPVPQVLLLDDLRHADAAGRGAHPPDLQGGRRTWACSNYAGLTLPLIASATATFLFRQFFLTIPDELAEAARIDGAGPMRFFWDVVVPLSQDQHRGAVRDPVHLRLEPVPVAAARHHRRVDVHGR